MYWCRCDVTSESDFAQLWDSTEAHFGGQTVDMLVNNAGINHKPGWKKCMDVDIVSILSYMGSSIDHKYSISDWCDDWNRAGQGEVCQVGKKGWRTHYQHCISGR